MVKLVAISRERHGEKRWRGPAGYGFAAAQSLIPLVVQEVSAAAVAMPIAFIQQSGGYVPVAVLSPVQGRNLFVAPTGQWLGLYHPASLRSYPFRFADIEGNNQPSLCIDEDSGCVVDASAEPSAPQFFEEDGRPSAAISAVAEFLRKFEQNRLQTEKAVMALVDAGLIQTWPLTVMMNKQQLATNGLYRIDETALNGVSAETLLQLRNTSALVLAYSQLISMHTTAVFGQKAAIQERIAGQTKPAAPSWLVTDDSGTLQFN